MVTVAEELPFAAVVQDKFLKVTCSNCFAVNAEMNKINLKKCAKCRNIYYCSKECQEEDWKFHKDECRFHNEIRLLADAEVRLMFRIIMRVKRGDLPVAFNGRTFDDLMDHKEEVEKDQDLDDGFNQIFALLGGGEKNHGKMSVVYNTLSLIMGENVIPFKEFLPLYGKRVVNGFDITFPSVLNDFKTLGIGLYLGLSAHDHSCRPNAEYYFNGPKMILRALDPNAEYSKNLTIPYMSLTLPREMRQSFLKSQYFFDCNCERCTDEELELLERSGKSSCCPEDGAVLPIHRKFLWYWEQPLACTNCGKNADIVLEQINDANKRLAKMCAKKKGILLGEEYSKEEIDKFMKTIKKTELILSPYNLNLLKLKEIVSAPSEKDYAMKSKFYSAVLKVAEKYSIPNTMYKVRHAVITAKIGIVKSCGHPPEVAYDKMNAAAEKALDVINEAYGSDHPLYKEMTELPGFAKSHYNKKLGVDQED